MFAIKLTTRHASRLPQLAATAIICWSLGTNTHVDAANTMATASDVAAAHSAKTYAAVQELPQNAQVLSPKDAELYRAIFAAQKKLDWTTADTAIAQLTDKRLMGHVLADRYFLRPASAMEMQKWLASYADLPEAQDIYDTVKTLPAPEDSKITKPSIASIWTSGDRNGVSFGFRTGDDGDNSTAAKRFSAKISSVLHHSDPFAAKTLLETEELRRDMDDDEVADIESRIAASFFYDGQIEHALRLAQDAAADDNALGLWIAGLSAWKLEDNAAAADAFAKLASEPGLAAWDRSAAGFWAWRALTRTGNKQQANFWLEQAAKQPHSFYGLLAAYILGRDGDWSWQLPELNAKTAQVLGHRAAGWRAIALLQVGQNVLAENELRHLNPQGSHDLQEAMLAVAETGHMPSLALQLGGIATNDNGKRYDAALYPVPPWQPEQGFQVDRALIYALMRHESQFDPMAVSERGACGLMQLMPSTANLIANGHVTDSECSGRVLDPAFNIALGQKYVRRLAGQSSIGDNLLYLLTAYNSGPTNLSRWTDDDTRHDPLLFIESLPVRETHDYVQQVLMQYWTYRARLSEPNTSLTQLARGEWPRYALHEDNRKATKSAETDINDGFEVASTGQ